MMATAKKAVKSKPKAKKSAVKKIVVAKKKAAAPAAKKKASKPAVKKKAVSKKAARPVVKKKAAKPAAKKRPAAKKKSPGSSGGSAIVKALRDDIKALKAQVQGLKADVVNASKHADILGKLTAKRSTAIAKFVSLWDRKAHAGATKSAKPKKKKK